ncbi:MAG: flippase-like domain-containing protein [Candidatus Aminicenantes bacterium]|nr:flippase-like domain-containing protein [Candidatus Aminicenantes bacterium]
MRKTWVKVLIVFLLSAVFLFFFFRKVEWKRILETLTDVDPILFILIILLVPLHLLTRAIRWTYLLRQEKKHVSLYNRFAANAVGFTVSLIFPGRLGELVKPLYLAKKENMKKGFVLGTQVVERIFDILTMCFLLGLFLLAKPIFPAYFRAKPEAYEKLQFWGIIGLVFAVVLVLLILSLYFFRGKTLSVIRFMLKPFPQKFSHFIMDLVEEFIQGLKFFHSAGDLFLYVLLSLFVWVGIMFYYWIFCFAYHVYVPFFLLVPYIFLTMVGASIPTPGMVGGYHYFSKLGMTSFLGIGATQAVAMTAVMHAIQLVVTCLVGYAILWKEGISLLQVKKLSEDKPE